MDALGLPKWTPVECPTPQVPVPLVAPPTSASCRRSRDWDRSKAKDFTVQHPTQQASEMVAFQDLKASRW